MNGSDQRPVAFTCNICGSRNASPLEMLLRETPTCAECGSTVRMRAMVHAVSMHVFGRSLVIKDMPDGGGARGFGLSDWVGYADRLRKKLSYTNTFYTREPRLDVTNPGADMFGTLDFIISTDVFEHVVPPVSKAFSGAYALLKPGGALIFSVPYALEGETKEHFPDLHDFQIVKRGTTNVLRNVTRAGAVQEFSDLCFHGGEGATLEMRIFSLSGIMRACRDAGFAPPEMIGEVPEFGIHWVYPWSQGMILRKPPVPLSSRD